MDRRHFIGSMATLGGGLLLDDGKLLANDVGKLSEKSLKKSELDEEIFVLISDLHTNPGMFQEEKLKNVVSDILKMCPLPREVIAFGDIAYHFGHIEEYERTKEILEPLENAGIGLTLGMGNHDRREEFSQIFKLQAQKSLLSGRLVYKITGKFVDFILLDSLIQDEDPTKYNIEGTLDDHQKKWLQETLSTYRKPVIVGAHHPISETGITRMLMDCPHCIGYIHGHNHAWQSSWDFDNWNSNRILRKLCLPSTGSWGDIGYCICRMTKDSATIELKQSDFYFPQPISEETRPTIWDAIVEDHKNSVCTFTFNPTQKPSENVDCQ